MELRAKVAFGDRGLLTATFIYIIYIYFPDPGITPRRQTNQSTQRPCIYFIRKTTYI